MIGLSCAAELGRLGAEVVVLEALPAVGQASSSRANGGFRAQFATEPNVTFSLFSIEAFDAMERDTGLLCLRRNGYLLMTGTDQGERNLRAAHELQVAMGVQAEWLAPDEVAVRAPFVRQEGLRAGTFHARDGFLDPAGLVASLYRSAASSGCLVLTDAAVDAVSDLAPGFGVHHSKGELRVESVVNAAGAHAADVAAMLGADIPVAPVRRNLAFFADPGTDPRAPMCVDLDTGVLIRPEGTSGWVAAYSDPSDPPGRDTSLDPRFLEQLAERAPHRFPFLTELPVDPALCWAGLYPETPDHHAIIGQDPAVPGFFHCAGFGGHGLMHSPAAGKALAELITSGSCRTFDLHPLRPSRFAEGDLVVEPAVF